MAISKSFLCLLVIFLLGFSSANAIPETRTNNLRNENLASFQASMHSHMDHEQLAVGNFIERKMADVELEDYPGSGANYRHTPRPQFKSCVDC